MRAYNDGEARHTRGLGERRKMASVRANKISDVAWREREGTESDDRKVFRKIANAVHLLLAAM